MNRRIVVTQGDQWINQAMASHWLSCGARVLLSFASEDTAARWREGLPEQDRSRAVAAVLSPSSGRFEELDNACLAWKGIDLLVHGSEMIDEWAQAALDSPALADSVAQAFEAVHQLNRWAINRFIGSKAGQILFVMIDDRLDAPDFPSSPVVNHGKLALMRALAKESARYRVVVQAVTLGAFRIEREQGAAVSRRGSFSYTLPELLASVDGVVEAGGRMHGRNIALGPQIARG